MRGIPRVRFDLRECVPMTRAEEHQCATDYVKTKDPALGRRLVMANMRLEYQFKIRLRRYLREELGDAVGSLDAAA